MHLQNRPKGPIVVVVADGSSVPLGGGVHRSFIQKSFAPPSFKHPRLEQALFAQLSFVQKVFKQAILTLVGESLSFVTELNPPRNLPSLSRCKGEISTLVVNKRLSFFIFFIIQKIKIYILLWVNYQGVLHYRCCCPAFSPPLFFCCA